MSEQIKVCVIDDEPPLTEVLCEGLKQHNFDAMSAHSGPEALEICSQNAVDLVLLDVAMPDMDGYEVCKQLKGNDATKDVTVIFVTGKGEPEDHEKGFDLGAVDYITKPFNLPMVMVRVEAALRMKHNVDPDPLDTDGLRDTMYTDHLTGLRNQRYLMQRLQEEADRSERYDFPISLVIMDLDGLRALDDEAGPVSLDDLMAEVGMSIRANTREYDVLARYDGTLFVALLPHTNVDQALEYGKKVMEDIEATIFADPNNPSKASMSVAAMSCHNQGPISADLIFGEAMKTLFEAKCQPRDNRIVGRTLGA